MTRYKKWIHDVKGLRLDCFEECLPSYDGYETFYCFYDDAQKAIVHSSYHNCGGWGQLVIDNTGNIKFFINDGTVFNAEGEYVRG